MGKHSRKANKGKNYRLWHATPQTPEALLAIRGKPRQTRQLLRATLRQLTWQKWRCYTDEHGRILNAPKDDNGVIKRRIRRALMHAIAKQTKDKLHREWIHTHCRRNSNGRRLSDAIAES